MTQLPPTLNIFYLHGFRSSPLSFKAQLFKQELPRFQALHSEYNFALHIPQLPVSPKACYDELAQAIQERLQVKEQVVLLGSSLGGFYANILAAQFGLKCVLVNPAVYPEKTLEKDIGSNTNYHTGIEEEFLQEYLDQLLDLKTDSPIAKLKNILLLVQSGDETLNYQEALDYFAGCNVNLTIGGNHSFENFEDYLPIIYRFFVTH